MKNKNNNHEEEFDFNDKKSFDKIASEISNGKIKNSKGLSLVPKNILSFLTGNIKSVAVFAVYFLGCGVVLNIIWLFKFINNYPIITIISVLMILSIIYNKNIFKYINKLKQKWVQLRKK